MTNKLVFDPFSKNHDFFYEFWFFFKKKKTGRTNWTWGFSFFFGEFLRNTEYGLRGGHIYGIRNTESRVIQAETRESRVSLSDNRGKNAENGSKIQFCLLGQQFCGKTDFLVIFLSKVV